MALVLNKCFSKKKITVHFLNIFAEKSLAAIFENCFYSLTLDLYWFAEKSIIFYTLDRCWNLDCSFFDNFCWFFDTWSINKLFDNRSMLNFANCSMLIFASQKYEKTILAFTTLVRCFNFSRHSFDAYFSAPDRFDAKIYITLSNLNVKFLMKFSTGVNIRSSYPNSEMYQMFSVVWAQLL